MKTKIIGISFGIILIGTIIFIVSNQESIQGLETLKEKISKLTPKKRDEKLISKEILKPQTEVIQKSISLGKMPDPSEREEMETFFNKAFIAWNDKVATLIINELKLGQDALDKYSKIRNDFYESQFSLFQFHSSTEPKGSENTEGQRRADSVINHTKEIMEAEYGINFDSDELNSMEDEQKIKKAVEKALLKDKNQFLTDHLNKVRDVLGDQGYEKYQKLKEDFNKEITEEGSEALFKI